MEEKTTIGERARLAMRGRLLRCPFGDNPSDCPLYEIRKLPLEERFAWLDSKTDEELIDLFFQHARCLEYKVKDTVG